MLLWQASSSGQLLVVFYYLFVNFVVNVSDIDATGDVIRSLYYEDFKMAWIEQLANVADVCKCQTINKNALQTR